ncbi:uracil-DNA glycosylase [bacterium]|nr:uracil-DNA glycosylase [bacterium]
MYVYESIQCIDFPCVDVKHGNFSIAQNQIDPQKITVFLISEAAPANLLDAYYQGEDALFARTTIQAFRDAGAPVNNMQDVLELGVYCTSAIKCGKTGYGIQTESIKNCCLLLEKEIALFPNLKVFLLMGDVAIKAVNEIAKRNHQARVIPAGATYKIRGGDFYFQGKHAFPSYTQAGPSFFIEKSKRKMIAEDIGKALERVASSG